MKILTVLLICCGIVQTSFSQITKDKKDEANKALNRAYKLLYQDGDRNKNLDSVVLLCSRVIEIDSNRISKQLETIFPSDNQLKKSLNYLQQRIDRN